MGGPSNDSMERSKRPVAKGAKEMGGIERENAEKKPNIPSHVSCFQMGASRSQSLHIAQRALGQHLLSVSL